MTLGKASRGQRFIGRNGNRKSGVDVILCFLLCAAFYCIRERERERLELLRNNERYGSLKQGEKKQSGICQEQRPLGPYILGISPKPKRVKIFKK